MTMKFLWILLITWLYSILPLCRSERGMCKDGLCVCRWGHVDCSHMHLQHVPQSIPEDTVHLKLSYNRIAVLGDNDFDRYPLLQYLIMDHNIISDIHPRALMPLRNLTYLGLNNNELNSQTLDRSVLPALNGTQIEWLILSGTKMNFTLSPESLQPLIGTPIKEIDFSGNRYICSLPDYVFSNLRSLRMLNFRYCQCTGFNVLSFVNTSIETLDFGYNHLWQVPQLKSIHTLKTLHLEHNAIMDVSGKNWNAYSSLEILNITSNGVYTLEDDFLAALPKLQILDLTANRILVLSDHPFKSTSLRILHMKENPVTFSFIYHQNIFREAVSLQKLYLGHFQTVDFMMEDLFSDLPHLEVLHIENVHRFSILTNNTFKKLTKLRELSLWNNNIRTMEANSLSDLTSLRSLDLRNNLLRSINSSMIADNVWKHLDKIGLSGNPFLCSCALFWLVDLARDSKINFYDLATSHCNNDPFGWLVSEISGTLTPENCIHKSFEISVVVTLALYSAVFAIVLNASVLYRFRWPLRLRMFHLRNWWRMRNAAQKATEDCEYQYDVFVIYNKTDSHWVLRVLSPQLEKHTTPKLRLCFYERNWLGGHDIVECISESIRISRKTMLIVTNEFAKCQWCYLEMTMAQHNVIDTDNDNVLLALMEDIEPINLNPRLALLMKIKAYLEWTSDSTGQRLFWEKMKLSLSASNCSLIKATPTDDELNTALKIFH